VNTQEIADTFIRNEMDERWTETRERLRTLIHDVYTNAYEDGYRAGYKTGRMHVPPPVSQEVHP
jgi:flagellar biosynthesis/type III secretory pathway protein FliH